MCRIKKAWWALLFFAAAALSLPAESFGVEVDPYLYNTLVGRIYLEYEKNTTEQTGSRDKQETSRFQQKYSLNMSGNMVSPRVLVYDAGIAFTDNNYSTTSTKINTQFLEYKLSTTVLPVSAIPLTLYGSRYENYFNTQEGGAYKRTTYGFNWFTKFKNLPKTTISAEKSKDQGRGIDTSRIDYRFGIKHDIGPSYNEFDYIGAKKTNESSGDQDTTATMHFKNNTRVSKGTSMSIGATRSALKSATGPDQTLKGLTLGIVSQPSQDFNQSHNYSYYSSEAEGKQEGRNYFGNMSMRFSNRLSSNLSLAINNENSDSATSFSKSDSVNASAGVTYRVSQNTNLTQSVSYLDYQSTTAADASNVVKRKIVRETTTVSHNRKLKWANLNTSYALGLVDDRSNTFSETEIGGRGLEQDVFVGLDEIDFNRFFGVNASARNYLIKNITGDVHGRKTEYHLDVFNKTWKRFVKLTGVYDRTAQSSYLAEQEKREETYRFDAESTYFRSTRLLFYALRINSFDQLSGFNTKSQENFTVSHSRGFLRGGLDLSYNLNIARSTYTGSAQKTTTKTYTANYTKMLIRNLTWQLMLQRTESEERESFSRLTSVRNAFLYPLRSWFLSGEYNYIVTEDNLSDRKENIMLLRATRTFVRMFY